MRCDMTLRPMHAYLASPVAYDNASSSNCRDATSLMVLPPLSHAGLYARFDFRPTVPNGSPVGVVKATWYASARSTAFCSRSGYFLSVRNHADVNPPTTRMVDSNTFISSWL